MHTYAKPRPESAYELPSIAEFRFHDALDVVARAEVDITVGWTTWPEVWHLDDERAFCCHQKASSLDSMRRWAVDPETLFLARRQGRREGGCTNRWVIVESRPRWRHPDESPVDERDAAAFFVVRRALSEIDVALVDAVIFDDVGRWWSMHELTSGSTRWE